ncbi:MAG: carboxyl-terminal processing protease CtpB [Cyanobacteria bacterium P01_A01_bin.84]
MKQSAKPNPKPQIAFLGGILATAATFFAFGITLSGSVKASLQDSPKGLVDQVWQLVYRDYVDSSFNQQDWLALRRSFLKKNYTSSKEAYGEIRKLLASLKDPYTRFLDPQQYKSLKTQSDGEISGIGVRMEFDNTSKQLIIVKVLDNSPAMKAGIKKGDEILAIDGKPTREMNLEAASNLIRGKVGTVVTLQVARKGEKYFNVELTRATIEVSTVNYTRKKEGQRYIGYIRLQEFSAHAAKQMQNAIADLETQKVDGFVLDLRGNPGGFLEASIEIAKMWLNDGDIVRTEYRKKGSKVSKANRSALTNKPLAILVDGNSASASEILTGALQDNQRAVVIGNKTFGKALVQAVHKLSDGSGVAITTAHYYTPKGTDINKKGISPDIDLYLTDSQKRQLATNPELLGTRKDPYYSRALKAL